jgi:hypothetical protein
VAPTGVQLNVEGAGTANLEGTTAWFDGGAVLSLAHATYEGVDVAPLGGYIYAVTGPGTASFNLRVFTADLHFTDYLGAPISGVSVQVRFANGTLATKTTAGDGSLVLSQIPLGTYDATVATLGGPTHISGDASLVSANDVKVALSVPTVGVVLAIIATLAAAFVVLRRNRPGLP